MTDNSDNPLALRHVQRLEKARKLGLKIVQAVGWFDGYEDGAEVYRASVQNFDIIFVIFGDGDYALLIAEDDRTCLNALWNAVTATANFDDRVVVEDGWHRRLRKACDKDNRIARRAT